MVKQSPCWCKNSMNNQNKTSFDVSQNIDTQRVTGSKIHRFDGRAYLPKCYDANM